MQRLYLRPVQIGGVSESRQGDLALAGTSRFFGLMEAIVRREDGAIPARDIVAVSDLKNWVMQHCPEAEGRFQELLERVQRPRKSFAGLSLNGPRVMGIINVTPDSFSDGGDRFASDVAIADGLAMRDAGAAVLDVGGESTRPGAEPVSVDEELRRVIPVIEGLSRAGAVVSVDTRHARVMREAVAAGAAIINDVSGLEGDPDSLEAAVECGVPVVVMHMQGTPQTMQKAPQYGEVLLDVFDYLDQRVEACVAAGIPREMVCVDPGIGFGKSFDHNLQLLEGQSIFHGTGCPVLLGVSRKSFIGKLSGAQEPKERLAGSLACALEGVHQAVQIYRVHDVTETAQAFAISRAIASVHGKSL